MPRKVLISGGAGFIGCVLAKQLLASGDDVAVMDNLHPQVHTTPGVPARLPREARFFSGDVAVPGNWSTVLRAFRPDAVVHLAAETGTGQSLTEAGRHATVNVVGTAAMLDAFTALQLVPEQLLIASSRAVYGDGAWADEAGTVFYPAGRGRGDLAAARWDPRAPNGGPAKAQPHRAGHTHPNPVSVYGATKLAQEQMMAAWAQAFGSALTVLRLQNVYGAGQAVGNPYTGVLTFFAKAALARQTLDVYEDGQIIRDFVHVDDVVQAMEKALAKPSPGVRRFDVGSGSATTIHEVAKLMARKAQAPEPRVSGKYRDGDVRAASCSIADVQKALGYAPLVSLDAGLGSLLAFVSDQKS